MSFCKDMQNYALRVSTLVLFIRGRSRKIERVGPDTCEGGPDACLGGSGGMPPPPPPPPRKFLHFLFSEVAFSAFSGKNSAQNLIKFIRFLTAMINSYQSCSNSTDLLNILYECCDTNLLMISRGQFSTVLCKFIRVSAASLLPWMNVNGSKSIVQKKRNARLHN